MRIAEKHSFVRISSGWPAVTVLENTAANFPFLANSVLFHQDNVAHDTSGNWVSSSESLGITLTHGANWQKDANGVYRAVDAPLTVTGALPDPTGKHVVVVESLYSSGATADSKVTFYDADTLGTAGFAEVVTQKSTGADFFAGVNQSHYLTYSSAGYTAFGAGAMAGICYANFAAAAGTGSFAYRAGLVGGVATTQSDEPTLLGDMTTALNPAGNPTDEVALAAAALTGHRYKMFGLLIMTQAPTDLAAAVEFMRANPGYLPIQWAGLS